MVIKVGDKWCKATTTWKFWWNFLAKSILFSRYPSFSPFERPDAYKCYIFSESYGSRETMEIKISTSKFDLEAWGILFLLWTQTGPWSDTASYSESEEDDKSTNLSLPQRWSLPRENTIPCLWWWLSWWSMTWIWWLWLSWTRFWWFSSQRWSLPRESTRQAELWSTRRTSWWITQEQCRSWSWWTCWSAIKYHYLHSTYIF